MISTSAGVAGVFPRLPSEEDLPLSQGADVSCRDTRAGVDRWNHKNAEQFAVVVNNLVTETRAG